MNIFLPDGRKLNSAHVVQKAIEDGGATQVVLCRMGEIKP